MKSAIFLTSAILSIACFGAAAQDSGPAARSVHYATRPIRNAALPGPTPQATVASVPTWQGTDGSYTYRMVGTDPTAAGNNSTTSIVANVIPLILTFSNGTVFDPTVSTACSSASPLSLLLASPLFGTTNFTVGGTNAGTTQYIDYFQRANFWKYTQPGGINPNYHVMLNAVPGNAISVTVPAGSGHTVAADCGVAGEVDIDWLDNYLEATVFPQLASAGVVPANLAIFSLANVVMYQTGAASPCCILGYHTGFNDPAFGKATQYYAVADFDTSGDFGSTRDVSPFSHEVAEWLDDPTGTNPTPSWGRVGQVTGCQSNLEVGDPMSGTNSTVTMSNNYSYHVQELAFKSWFYRDAPSSGINGWYSSNGTFTSPAGGCTSSATTLSIDPANLAPGSATAVDISVIAAGKGATGTPTGTATLVTSLGSTPVATYTLTNGKASGTTTALPTGSYTVTANYAGDAAFAPSSSVPVSVNVGNSSVTVSPVSLTFASIAVGTSSAPQTVTLSNTGTAALAISSIGLAGASPGDFKETNNCGRSVANGATCTITVTFLPTATGTRTATLSITDNASGSPQSVPLSGIATAAVPTPRVALSPISLHFPNTAVGSSASPQSFSLTNTGTASLTNIAISIAGTNAGDFSQTNNCAATLAAAASCSVTVIFKAGASGPRTASVSVADNASNSPQSVALSGNGGTTTGSGSVSLSPASLSFPSTPAGSTSAAQSVTITNTGNATVRVESISIDGASGRDFQATSKCGRTLAPSSSCSVSVVFSPSETGGLNAQLKVGDNAAGSPQTVSLTGTATASTSPPPTIASLSPTSVAAGRNTTITVTGTGFNQHFRASASAAQGDFAVAIPLQFVSSTEVKLEVGASGKAAFTATLTITNPDGQSASTQLSVTK